MFQLYSRHYIKVYFYRTLSERNSITCLEEPQSRICMYYYGQSKPWSAIFKRLAAAWVLLAVTTCTCFCLLQVPLPNRSELDLMHPVLVTVSCWNEITKQQSDFRNSWCVSVMPVESETMKHVEHVPVHFRWNFSRNFVK